MTKRDRDLFRRTIRRGVRLFICASNRRFRGDEAGARHFLDRLSLLGALWNLGDDVGVRRQLRRRWIG